MGFAVRVVCIFVLFMQSQAGSVVMTVSVPSKQMHSNGELIVTLDTVNNSDDVVFLGSGRPGGVRIELRNESGSDVGNAAMGGTVEQGRGDQGPVIHPNRVSIGPHSTRSFTFHFHPLPNTLVPGVYHLRVHRMNASSDQDIVSNTVDLVVVP